MNHGETDSPIPPSGPMDRGTITRDVARIREGDETAFARLWKHLLPRLEGVAASKLGARRLRVANAGDAASDAMATFFRRVHRGELNEPENREVLQALLVEITRRKLENLVRWEQTQKRGKARELNESDVDKGGSGLLSQLPDGDDAEPIFHAVSEEVVETLASTLALTPESWRPVIRLRLEGLAVSEIAETLRIPARTARRYCEDFARLLRSRLDG